MPQLRITHVVGTGKTSLRRSAMEIQKQQADAAPDSLEVGGSGSGSGGAGAVATPAFSTFEAAIEASGLLANRPPVPAGDSGRSSYLVQPMQMLSWYPRCV